MIKNNDLRTTKNDFYSQDIWGTVNEQLKRIPGNLPKMKINKEINSLKDIEKLTIDDFELVGYSSYGKIKAELFTGLKK